MRDNFAVGIYPNVRERRDFAAKACDHVEQSIAGIAGPTLEGTTSAPSDDDDDTCCCLISFSFVNKDLRDIFRSRFPHARWVLIDTSEDEAQRRIDQRQGHFYKGKKQPAPESNILDRKKDKSCGKADGDNREWNFAPVTFPHVVLDGRESVTNNAHKVMSIIKEEVGRAAWQDVDKCKNNLEHIKRWL